MKEHAMRNPTKSLTEYQGLSVLTPRYRDPPYSYYINYLDRNRELLNRMLERHSQVLFFRMDLRFPDRILWYDEKELFFRFLDQYRKLLVSRELDPQYMIRMEQATGLYCHFHAVFLLNGNKACHAYYYKREADLLWQKILNEPKGGLVDFCNRDRQGEPYPEEIRIVRPPQSSGISVEETAEYQEAFRIMSYLAKHVPEDRIPSRQRKVFCSLNNRV